VGVLLLPLLTTTAQGWGALLMTTMVWKQAEGVKEEGGVAWGAACSVALQQVGFGSLFGNATSPVHHMQEKC